MQVTFDEIRENLKKSYELTDDEHLLLRFLFTIPETKRQQGIAITEVELTDGKRYLHLNTPVASLSSIDPVLCLKINTMQPIGHLAATDIEGEPYIIMCENLPYSTLSLDELKYVVEHLARTADRLEESLMQGEDLY